MNQKQSKKQHSMNPKTYCIFNKIDSQNCSDKTDLIGIRRHSSELVKMIHSFVIVMIIMSSLPTISMRDCKVVDPHLFTRLYIMKLLHDFKVTLSFLPCSSRNITILEIFWMKRIMKPPVMIDTIL